MKKKIVLALITATMVGASLTGCGGKTTTDTATETTQSVEDTSNVDESSEEDVETVETVEDSTDENTTDSVESTNDETAIDEEDAESDTDEMDESALLDSEIPNDPTETIEIVKKIKDPDIRYDYYMKANDKYLEANDDSLDKWTEVTEPYWEAVIDKTEITE